MKQAFIKKKFSRESLDVLHVALEVIEDYSAQGYTLSLRQLYYQLVSKNIVPNTEQSYSRVGNIIADARMAGLADWEMIEDRNRSTVKNNHWNGPRDIVQAAARQFRINRWETQPNYVEVMVEKQALEGVLEPVCRELDVPFTSNKGYSSVSMMFETGQRLKERFSERVDSRKLLGEKWNEFGRFPIRELIEKDWFPDKFYSELSDAKTPLFSLTKEAIKEGWPRIVILYMGDHDPSGIDMTRDVRERLSLFSDYTPLEVHRLALNMEQIEELQPPENPAKMTDSRAKSYVEKFGTSSWELDAVKPEQLAALVRNQIVKLRSQTLWDAAVKREAALRGQIEKAAAKMDGGETA